MSVDDLNRLARKIDAGVEELIGEYLAKNGVPQSVQAVSHMAEDLFPEVSRYRRKMYRQQVIEMGKAAAAHGVEVSPAKLDFYDVNALYTALSDAVGLTPKSRAFVQVEFLDEATQKLVRRKVLIRNADAFDPVVVGEVTKRLGARVGRHVRSGARKAVSNTAMVGKARDSRSKKPVKMGYARVLSGAENCSFCAMLASRGPVYSEDTVTRRRDGRKYHDHCDCQGVLVFHGYGWEGEEQYRRLEKEWMAADEGDGSGATLSRFKQRLKDNDVLAEIALSDESMK
ncbi:VG15 protein [Corynebacterium striatum]|uniref:VG15 protein n=1 Tax=Corynebacterium striatum TaxID=43770 RepID=UPI003F815C25